jgi:hypothetical protein
LVHYRPASDSFEVGHHLRGWARTVDLFCLLVTQVAFVQQPPVRSRCAVFHRVPGFDHDLQVADRPELPVTDPDIRGNHLIGTIVMHAPLQVRPLLPAQFERIVALPLRLQPRQALVLIFLRPLPHPTITALDKMGNVLSGHTTAIQAHRLQASQLIGIARMPFGSPECLYLFIRQLKLSLCHTPDYTSGDFYSICP